jgi:ribosomal protein L11 methyltransferase
LRPPLVRVGIRVRADHAEVALAQLLPLLPGGAEERSLEDAVEYSLYAPAGELPRRADIRALVGDALVDVVTEPVPEGWERRWHDYLRPVSVGSLVVRPPWIEGDAGDLVIDPGVYFGAGTHPTTQLCLALLQEVEPRGALCDWGAGTGVLAIAAARLGWEPVIAVELAAGALETISVNASVNHVAVTTRWVDLTTTPAPWTPVVVANLPGDMLRAVMIERPPELLIASGVLAREAGEVAAAFGMREQERRTDGEWAAVVLA